jgi:hypothetical protein
MFLACPEIRVTRPMLFEDKIDTEPEQCRDQKVAAEGAVSHHHVTLDKAFQQFTEQSVFPGSLTLVSSHSDVEQCAISEGNHPNQARYRETRSLLLHCRRAIRAAAGL